MPDLPTAPLGTTGMQRTRVGLGAWAIGGGGWFGSIGHQDDESSRAAIRHAVERGVNWIDTAAVYAHGGFGIPRAPSALGPSVPCGSRGSGGRRAFSGTATRG